MRLTLSVVTERHVLAQGEHRARAEHVLDIHARRVHLIIEGEALLFADAALSELEHSTRGAHKDHLPVELIEEDHALEVLEAVGQQVLGHLCEPSGNNAG